VPDREIENAVLDVCDLPPRGISRDLDLRKPIYKATAACGHFARRPETPGRGRDARTDSSWERTDRVRALKRAVRGSVARRPASVGAFLRWYDGGSHSSAARARQRNQFLRRHPSREGRATFASYLDRTTRSRIHRAADEPGKTRTTAHARPLQVPHT